MAWKDPSRRRAWMKAYRLKHQDRFRARDRAYAFKNADRLREKSRRWRIENPEKVAEHRERYRKTNQRCWKRAWRESVETLGDRYVKQLLYESTGVRAASLNSSRGRRLIDAKRAQMLVQRAIQTQEEKTCAR